MAPTHKSPPRRWTTSGARTSSALRRPACTGALLVCLHKYICATTASVLVMCPPLQTLLARPLLAPAAMPMRRDRCLQLEVDLPAGCLLRVVLLL